MRFRKLRIAWSATCLIACVLLITLWVQSRHTYDLITGPLPGSPGFFAMSRSGGLGIGISRPDSGRQHTWAHRTIAPMPVTLPYQTVLGFLEYLETPDAYRIRAPYWFLVVNFIALTGLPWMRWHFSLRTLLIATTLVAVVMGLIVWSTH